MKIFNIEPIKVIENTVNKGNLNKSLTNFSYESGFSITGKVIDSLNTLLITYHILYCLSENDGYSVTPPNESGQYTIHIEGEFGRGEVILSYESSCQFNYESEGFDADVFSITEFLAEYCAHTKKILEQNGMEIIQEKEEEMHVYHTIKADALIAIDNLRANNMYEF